MERQEWLLKRNCSLTPRQTLAAFGVLCGLSFGIALVFLLMHGTWVVFGFAIVEMTAVAAAFLHYAWHAADCERIALVDGSLLVEQFSGSQVRKTRMDACWIRIRQRAHGMIAIEARGARVEVGRFATEERRRQIARELRRGVHGVSLVGE